MSDPEPMVVEIGESSRVALPPWLLGMRWAIDVHFAAEWIALRGSSIELRAARQPQVVTPTVSKGVAVIPVHGVMYQRAASGPSACGVGCDEVAYALRSAVANPQVGGVLLDIDSPGGSTFGVDELAAEVMALREVKPIRAVGNSRMDSAAYWLAAATSEISLTPGGEAGSIGVYAIHAVEPGNGVTVISAGKYKAEAHPFAPLSEDAKVSIQARVNHQYDRFVARVMAGRGVSEETVRHGYGEGRALPAQMALAEGLIDRVETFDQALGRLAADVASGAVAGVAANELNGADFAAQVRQMEIDLERDYLGGRS